QHGARRAFASRGSRYGYGGEQRPPLVITIELENILTRADPRNHAPTLRAASKQNRLAIFRRYKDEPHRTIRCIPLDLSAATPTSDYHVIGRCCDNRRN